MGRARAIRPEAVWTEDALTALLAVLFDIRRELAGFDELLEDDDDGSETEEATDDS